MKYASFVYVGRSVKLAVYWKLDIKNKLKPYLARW